MPWRIEDNGTESYLKYIEEMDGKHYDDYPTYEEARAELIGMALYRIKAYSEMVEYLLPLTTEDDYE